MRGPHDIGGTNPGPIDPVAHVPTFWEKQIDAIHTLIGDDKRRIATRDENRRFIEALGEDVYNTLDYYERWTAAMTRHLVEKGVLTQDEIDTRVAEVRRRLAATGELELSPGEADKLK